MPGLGHAFHSGSYHHLGKLLGSIPLALIPTVRPRSTGPTPSRIASQPGLTVHISRKQWRSQKRRFRLLIFSLPRSHTPHRNCIGRSLENGASDSFHTEYSVLAVRLLNITNKALTGLTCMVWDTWKGRVPGAKYCLHMSGLSTGYSTSSRQGGGVSPGTDDPVHLRRQ